MRRLAPALRRAPRGALGLDGYGAIRRLALLAAAALCLTLGVASRAAAQEDIGGDPTARAAVAAQSGDSALEAQVKALSSQLRCPVCQGLSLQDSPSGLAQEMRGLIRDRLKAGQTPEQVKAYFVSKYGEWILMKPPARGFNLTVYLVPVVLVLGGGAFLLFTARRWTRQPPPGFGDGGEGADVAGDAELPREEPAEAS